MSSWRLNEDDPGVEAAEFAIKKAKLLLQKHVPFFYYLAAFLNPIPCRNGSKIDSSGREFHTAAVDVYSNLYYVPEFINQLTLNQLGAILAHEVIHTAFAHIGRTGGRNANLWNIAIDIIDNYMVNFYKGNIQLPDNVPITFTDKDGKEQTEISSFYIPTEDTITLKNFTAGKEKTKPIVIADISNKTGEQIYSELIQQFKNSQHLKPQGIDFHIMNGMGPAGEGGQDKKEGEGDNNGQGLSEEKLKELRSEWAKRLANATEQVTQQRGTLPGNLQREIDDLNNPKAPWYTLLFRYITERYPNDWTWNRLQKRLLPAMIVMPTRTYEGLDIIVHLDTSGSMSAGMMSECISELYGILQTFQNIKLTFLSGDADIHTIQDFDNARPEETIRQLKFEGGGGTSHVPLGKWIKDKKLEAEVVICLTDGYTEFPNKKDLTRADWFWVVPQGGAQKDTFPFGEVLTLYDVHRNKRD